MPVLNWSTLRDDLNLMKVPCSIRSSPTLNLVAMSSVPIKSNTFDLNSNIGSENELKF